MPCTSIHMSYLRSREIEVGKSSELVALEQSNFPSIIFTSPRLGGRTRVPISGIDGHGKASFPPTAVKYSFRFCANLSQFIHLPSMMYFKRLDSPGFASSLLTFFHHVLLELHSFSWFLTYCLLCVLIIRVAKDSTKFNL